MEPSEAAKALGALGGRARAARLSAGQRRRIAAMGARARLASLQAARRLAENFRYITAVEALQGPRPAVRRVRTCTGPLPGIYRQQSR
jgi:hypothetical protein